MLCCCSWVLRGSKHKDQRFKISEVKMTVTKIVHRKSLIIMLTSCFPSAYFINSSQFLFILLLFYNSRLTPVEIGGVQEVV